MNSISAKEILYLRELAKKQMEYAHLSIMEERAQNWLRLNTGRPAIPPVMVDSFTFEPDMLPPGIFQCSSEAGREIEKHLLKNIREFELLDDDKVMPDHFPVNWIVRTEEFGVKIKTHFAADRTGRKLGHRFEHPIVDLAADLDKLKPLKLHADMESSVRQADFVREILGDAMPVAMRGAPPYVGLTEKAVKLMGLEKLLIAVYEQPELVHRLMRFLADDQITIMEFYEREGLITRNNGNQGIGAGGLGYTDRLPSQTPVTLKQIWVWVEAEEMAAVSPIMFMEFFFPYFAEAAALGGLISYGCCEPLHDVFPMIIRGIPHIGNVSVSPWCDQKMMGDFLRGSDIVFSRKPFPNYLGLGAKLDEEAWRGHIRETLDAAKGCQCEIIMRDIYQVESLETVKLAIRIAREEVER